MKSRIAPSATVTKVTGVALSPSVDGCLERSAQNALRRDDGANANWRRDLKSHQRFCRLLDRTPSGRSEDKLVFLIQYSVNRKQASGVRSQEEFFLITDT